jgi:ParB family chromosome partitioning protein
MVGYRVVVTQQQRLSPLVPLLQTVQGKVPMKIINLPLELLREAPWNPNQMEEVMINRLHESISHYGLVEPLIVRMMDDNQYEVLSGNQRLKVIGHMDFESVPCVILDLDDNEAMLLAQVLNGLRGEDDLALKGTLLKNILSSIPENEVL